MRIFVAATATVVLGLAGFLVSGNDAAGAGDAKASLSLVRFRIEPGQSKFMVHADRAGLAWFKGHSHRIAVRDFSGEAELTLDAVNPASLNLVVRADSLEETDPVFTPQQKAIINKEIKEIVLETAKFPEIRFKSADVNGKLTGGAMEIRIGGDLTLHGVTKRIEIPATVTVSGDKLHAVGEFKINRKDFGVNATSAFHGFVKIRHTIKFEFDIIAQRL